MLPKCKNYRLFKLIYESFKTKFKPKNKMKSLKRINIILDIIVIHLKYEIFLLLFNLVAKIPS